MDVFKLTVLSIATIILVLIFTGIGILISTTQKNAYPPTANTCPDYWSVNTSGANCCTIPPYSATNPNPNVGNIYDANGNLMLSNYVKAGMITTPGLTTADDGTTYINFNDTRWTTFGLNSICAQKAWTGLTNLVWDGISNYNSC